MEGDGGFGAGAGGAGGSGGGGLRREKPVIEAPKPASEADLAAVEREFPTDKKNPLQTGWTYWELRAKDPRQVRINILTIAETIAEEIAIGSSPSCHSSCWAGVIEAAFFGAF